MFSDAINCTHNGTGGSGTITLASVTGYPQPTDWMGTSGTRIVYYEIAEYTDSTLVTLSKYERGIGSLVLSTNVLTRTPVLTWTSGGSYVTSGATNLTFGNTAANVRIMLGASAATQRAALPTAPGAFGSTNRYYTFNSRQTLDSSAGATTLTNGTKYWIPIEFIAGFPITTVAIECTTLANPSNLRLGIYDWDTDGLPGNLITEFTSSTQFNLATTGLKTVTPASPIFLPPGWYFLCFQGDSSTHAVRNAVITAGYGDSASTRDVLWATKAGTYGALPSTGDKSGLTQLTKSAGGNLWAAFK